MQHDDLWGSGGLTHADIDSKIDTLVIESGAVTLSGMTTNVTASSDVTFTRSFSATPSITLTPVTGLPANVTCSVAFSPSPSPTGFRAMARRSDSSTSVELKWIAVET